MKKCLIIGGTGFFGLHLIPTLINKNRQITVISKNKKPSRPLPRGVRYFSDNYKHIRNVDEIICLAHSTVPISSMKDPIGDLNENLPHYIKLFEMACSMSIRKLILVSSGGAVYGNVPVTPISEDFPTSPISAYGITKLTIEKYALMYHALKKLPVVIIRPSNAFGVGQLPYTGQGFISTAMASILDGKKVNVYGRHGTVRDYIYISDVIEGIVAALEKGVPGQIYNVGSGIGRNNLEVLEQIKPIAISYGLKTKIDWDPFRNFDVPVNILNSQRLSSATGWRPKVSFNDGLIRTWKWLFDLQKK